MGAFGACSAVSGGQGSESGQGDTTLSGEDRPGRSSTAPGHSSETRGLWISRDTSAFCGLNKATLGKCFVLPSEIPPDLEMKMTPSGSICRMRQVTSTELQPRSDPSLLMLQRRHEIFAWSLRRQQKQTLPSALRVGVRHNHVLECFIRTGGNRAVLPSSLSLICRFWQRGRRAFALPHWGQQVWTCFLRGGCPGHLPDRSTIPNDFYRNRIPFCLIPGFHVEGLHFATCSGLYLLRSNAAWGLAF